MSLNNLMHDAFANCIVTEDKIIFDRTFTDEEISKIYKKFTDDLYGFNVPHYRVVGIGFRYPLGSVHSLMLTNTNYNRAMFDIECDCRKVIPVELGGNDIKEGCFVMTGEDTTGMDPRFLEEWSDGRSKRGIDFLAIPHDQIGGIVLKFDVSEEMALNHITSDGYASTMSSWYSGVCMPGKDLTPPKFLFNNINLCKFDMRQDRATNNERQLMLLYKRGTGVLDYSETQAFFNGKEKRIMPVRTVYDLVSYFHIDARFDNNSLTWHERYIHESISIVPSHLQIILNDYGKDFE